MTEASRVPVLCIMRYDFPVAEENCQERYYRRGIPAVRNLVLAGLLICINTIQFFLLPLLFSGRAMPLLIVLLFAPLNTTLWGLIHESFHGNLLPGRGNKPLGRLLTVIFGSSWTFLRFGHLSHHRFNRSVIDRPDLYNPAVTSWKAAAAAYYPRLLGGLYLTEVLLPALFFLPVPVLERIAERVFGRFHEREAYRAKTSFLAILVHGPARREIQRDCLMAAFLMLGSAAAYAGRLELLAGIILIRAFFISFADNLLHYGSPAGARRYAYNLQAKWPGLLLNFNYHGLHHADPTIPWTALPGRFSGRVFDRTYSAVGLAQLRGPLPLEQSAKPAV